MPSIERIEEFHASLAQLGNEPEIAANRGEIIEPPVPPKSALDDDDLSSLLGDASEDSESFARNQAERSQEEELQDTSALLADLDTLFDDGNGTDDGAPDGKGPDPGDRTDDSDAGADDDPFAAVDFGDDDIPGPPDFSFDPDESFDSEGAFDSEDAFDLEEAFASEDAPDPVADDEESLFGEDDSPGDDFFGTDEPGDDPLGEIEDLDSLEDADGPGDFDSPDDFGTDEPGDDPLGEIEDLDSLDDADGPGDFDSLDDFEAPDDFDSPEDLDSLEDLDELDETEELDPELEALSQAALGADLPAGEGDDPFADLQDFQVGDSFDDGFGSQVDAEFGDLLDSDSAEGETDDPQAAGPEMDPDELSDDPFADDDDPFDLPSVDDDLSSLSDEGFSLGDFGEEFDIDEDSIDEFAGLEVDEDVLDDDGEDLEAAPSALKDRQFSDQEFSAIQKTLNSLPLNVRIAAEEAIGSGKGAAQAVEALLKGLIQGESPSVLAERVSDITGKPLVVPKGYQKLTGAAFDAYRRSVRYRLVHVVLPLVRVAALATVAALILGFFVHRFVYRPIHAGMLYRQGYAHGQEDRFHRANETFQRAWELRPRRIWFLRYARLYAEKRQYDLAVEKYDQLVFGMDAQDRDFLRGMAARGLLAEVVTVDSRGRGKTVYDFLRVDREAILEHGLLQSEVLANYERADQLYEILLYGDEFDYDGLMGRGDNALRWAREDSSQYERARLAYADLLARYGDIDPVLMRFLRYFVRTDNLERTRELVHLFEVQSPRTEVDPRIYAEAAGYLLDKGIRADVRSMLVRAMGVERETPEIHYHMARYAREMQAPLEERRALDNARMTFAAAEPLSRERLRQQIDTDIRSAEYWFVRDELLKTVSDSDAALERYQEALSAGLLAPDRELARVFAVRADVEYYASGDFERALRLYDRAASQGYRPDEVEFKRGFINYEFGRFDRAMEQFLAIGSGNALEGGDNVLFARGNTLFQRGNYVAAEATYRSLMGRLLMRRDRIQTLLVEEDSAHRGLVEYLYRVKNNLGVTLHRQTERSLSSENLQAEALVFLQQSAEIAENYLRDRDTGERALARNLAYLNVREILNPTRDYRPQIFQRLPRDMEQVLF
ncbi:hypothetical protein SAMN05920897_10126 [Alkalispirochaeta americana]|uniref:Uncharacterized protein n=1 Tax=Alkalispirochaeta americana TaxID=159291 RepID=A0A1N6N4G5_9SPIO|nr:hypothetical protein [Alkalispirochaeta americana]SIP86952.1 hypothetical protein SAMN05920897_10126 [Alkalispirochaeta americana]